MKKLYTMVLAAALVGTFTSCDDFLDYKPTAVVDEDKAFSEPIHLWSIGEITIPKS